MNIFVAKLSSTTTGDDLAVLFGEYGTVASAKVIMDRETGNSKCFGFVEMDDDMEATNAMDALNGIEFQGRRIVVKRSAPREEGEARPHRDGEYRPRRPFNPDAPRRPRPGDDRRPRRPYQREGEEL